MASFKPAAILAVALTIAAAASPALAQTTEAPDVSSLPVRLGPFYIAPALALTNVGVDTNVFNEADDQLPKEDFTVTLTPKANVWLRLGGTWLNAATQEDLVWYRKYTSENSANNVTRVNWLVPLTRFTFAVGGESVHTKERPGFEIDARVPRTEGDLNGAVEISVLSKTHVGVRADRRTTDFKDVTYLDVNLQNELNRTSTTGAVTVRNELTPLTNLTLDFSRQEDRFEFDPLRDSNSTQVAVGLKFNQLALLKGGVQFGIRDFSPVSAGIPGFTGLTSAVDLTYVLLGSTRLSFGTTRDVQYLIRHQPAVLRADQCERNDHPADFRACRRAGANRHRVARIPHAGRRRSSGRRSRGPDAHLRRRPRLPYGADRPPGDQRR